MMSALLVLGLCAVASAEASDPSDTVTITALNGSGEAVELSVPRDPAAHCHFGYGVSGYSG